MASFKLIILFNKLETRWFSETQTVVELRKIIDRQIRWIWNHSNGNYFSKYYSKCNKQQFRQNCVDLGTNDSHVPGCLWPNMNESEIWIWDIRVAVIVHRGKLQLNWDYVLCPYSVQLTSSTLCNRMIFSYLRQANISWRKRSCHCHRSRCANRHKFVLMTYDMNANVFQKNG